MGNASGKDASEKSDQRDSNFRPLTSDQRSATFDERVLMRNRVTLESFEFRPLTRAMTYDSRVAVKPMSTVDDVLYRRYFNARPRRDSERITQNKIGDKIRDKKGCPAAVVVDPFSTGMMVAKDIIARGYICICVYSDTLTVMKELIGMVPEDIEIDYAATIYHDGGDTTKASVLKTIDNLNSLQFDIVAVLPGAETGVELTDKLSEAMGLVTNKCEGTEARRNKYLMGEKIRSAGLRAVKQRSVTQWPKVVEFIENELKPEPFEVIVKPVKSAGSDDVFLCRSMDDVKVAFGNVQGKINCLGLENTSTLIQEYLKGTEYVVDTVSRNGKHKVVAIWEYDKRAVNGGDFVYYGLIMRAVSGEIIESIVQYTLKVLDALGIKNGPGHAEVKWVKGEPCLVEIGARCHGGEGAYMCIADQCFGYNQVKVAVDSYLDAKAFEELPDMPLKLKRYGCEVMLVSYNDGILKSYPGLKEIEQMPSYLKKMIHLQPGERLSKTIDMFTTPGSVMLVNDSEELLMKDYTRIHELGRNGLYAFSPIDVVKTKPPAVVVVDPFSTGAVLAKHITDRGYRCICAYSNTLENMMHIASLVPEGIELIFDATIAYGGTLEAAVAEIKALDGPIVAVMAGAETGVLLADKLAAALGLPHNDMKHTAARRNKYLMGETLRNAGLNAVKQTKATAWEEAEQFIKDLAPNPFQVVLKPPESAGTDDVVLCLSMEEAELVFRRILGKVNGLGIENTAVLVQEYLEGTEYVLDTVSHKGKHKVVAVYEYDKRRVNDAAFVYFGVKIMPANDEVIKSLIQYQFTVLDALGIENGPAHGEVKFCKGRPILIEVGARCHGAEGTWIDIADRCVGYNQVDVSIDSYLAPEKFDKVPDQPNQLKKYGCEAMLVSYQDGSLKALPGIEEIKTMPSFLRKEIFVHVGDHIKKTVDMFTSPGSVMLVHEQLDVLEKDLLRIRELERSGLYDLS